MCTRLFTTADINVNAQSIPSDMTADMKDEYVTLAHERTCLHESTGSSLRYSRGNARHARIKARLLAFRQCVGTPRTTLPVPIDVGACEGEPHGTQYQVARLPQCKHAHQRPEDLYQDHASPEVGRCCPGWAVRRLQHTSTGSECSQWQHTKSCVLHVACKNTAYFWEEEGNVCEHSV